MTLAAGTRLGPYEIQSAIGAGGMGEVYKGRDTRLDRTVAIKILPPAAADDPERRARFEREAKTIAGLNHPHICALHDVGNHQGSMFLVMEHIAGETLAQRLGKGPLPLEQALAVATEIADALAAAHRQGVIHRDLKPGNVMLTKSGAKLLDFGLAKLRTAGAPLAASLTMSVPTQEPATSVGTILGTMPYMAPEQLEGKETDARSDIFAFGAVLYEMLTGKRAFGGESQASIITAIMASHPPPVSSVQPVTPPALDRLVAKCLAKDPERRWQTADDLADELQWMASASGARELRGTVRETPRRRLPLLRSAVLVLAGLMFGAGLVAAWWVLPSWRAPRPLVQRLHVSLPELPLPPTNPAISPDGATILFASMDDSVKHRLFVRGMSDGKVRVLEGTDEAYGGCFSPAGDEVAFVTATGLLRTSIAGGPPVRILEAGGIFPHIRWSTDGYILFTYRADPGVWRVSTRGGGRPEAVVPAGGKPSEDRYRSPQMLPDGSAVLFVRFTFDDGGPKGSIVSYSLKDRKERAVIRGDDFDYLPATGHLVYLSEGNLVGARFNPASLSIEGEPVALERDVSLPTVLGAPARLGTYDVSGTGTLVYVTPPREALAWRRRNGGQSVLPALLPGTVQFLSLSPDARRAVLTVGTEGSKGPRLFMATLDGDDTALTPLTDRENDMFGTFTCDGTRLLFTRSDGRTDARIYSIPTTRSAEPQLQVRGGRGNTQKASSFACPGDTFLFNDIVHESVRGKRVLDGDVWEQRLDRPETARRLVGGAQRQIEAALSPDGRWIAYQSESTPGRFDVYDVYVEGYPSGPKTMVSSDGGSEPVWNPRGGELFYQNRQTVFSVRIENGRRVGAPTAVFQKMQSGPFARQWDVAPDGERFLVAARLMQPHINVVVNWLEELKAKVPSRR